MDISNQDFGMDGDSDTDSSEVMKSEEEEISEMDKRVSLVYRMMLKGW